MMKGFSPALVVNVVFSEAPEEEEDHMKLLRFVIVSAGIIFALALLGAWADRPAAAADAGVSHPVLQPATGATADLDGECAITAVGLIGAWVDAGAPNGEFPFTSNDDLSCTGTFEQDVLPLFTEADVWFPGSQACTECHFDNSADSRHEMNLGSYEGLMLGGDVLSAPPGVAIIAPGDWANSKLRARLRNNRMPPGWEFDIEEGNRNGPTLTVAGGEITAVDLIGAWVDAGAPETDSFKFADAAGAEHQATFETDILPLFTEADVWFPGSQACTECHFDNSADSRHEMDLGTYAGLMLGGDVLSAPPGVAIVVPGDWANSKLRERLRNNRMPPGWEFDIEEGNRNGPVIVAGNPVEAVAEATPTPEAQVAAAPVEPTTAPTIVIPTAAPTPAPTRSETTKPAPMPVGLVVLGGLTLLAALGLLAAYLPRLSDGARGWNVFGPIVVGVTGILFTTAALYTLLAGPASRVTTIHEEVPYPAFATAEVVVTATIEPGVLFESVEGRVEAWQARIPSDYTSITNPYAPINDEVVDAGRRLFRDNNCAVCHGTGLQGDGDFSEALNPKPVNLTDKALMDLPFMSDTYLYWRISEGGSQSPFFSAMPAWKQVLSPEERWQLVAFVRSQTAETISDEDQAAVAVIEKSGCFACHRFANRGGKIGPGWDGINAAAATRIADMSAEDYIRQSILDPGAFIVPGFEDKAELMPRDFDEKLASEEIDLIVYLLTEPH